MVSIEKETEHLSFGSGTGFVFLVQELDRKQELEPERKLERVQEGATLCIVFWKKNMLFPRLVVETKTHHRYQLV